MEERELAALIEQEIASSIGSHTGELSAERAQELKYYNSEPFGNEMEGESQVVSSDVFDTVEGMLPALLRIFTSSDQVVAFEENGPEDEEKAKQRTEVCNYIFYRQNNGFLILYEWFKDALINKNGVVKYWWDSLTTTTKESYEGLSEGQLLKFRADNDVEILSVETVDDEGEIEQRRQRLEKVMQMADQRAASEKLPPDAVAQMKAQFQQQADAMPKPVLYNVEIRVKKDKSKVCIETVPPEEFFISSRQRCVSIQDTIFCAHKRLMSISELREMGCPDEILEELGGTAERDDGPESIERDRFSDEWHNRMTRNEANGALKEVWVSDCYLRVDHDDDGVAELRHIIKVGGRIWINEECDHIGFAALTPIIMPHRWLGKSAAELVMADQFTKSAIWRQTLNNLYLSNNPQMAVLSSASGVVQANLDDLLVSRAGGIKREYVQNAIRPLEVPFVAQHSFAMLEYIDSQKEVRTGQTRYSQGTDADSLNKTARGIQMIQQAGQQRGDLIARIFAETGVKDLMQGIAYMISKYSTKAMTLKLRNKWVEIDPREWKEKFDMTINVGLGTGNKDVQLAHLGAMAKEQLEMIQLGKGYLVTDENLFNLRQKMGEAMGFKHPELFISDPQTVKPPPPQPNPEMVKIQSDAQTDKAKIASNEKIRQFDAQTQKMLAEISANTQYSIAQLNSQTQKEIAQMQINANAQSDIFNANKDAQLKQLDHQHGQLTNQNDLESSNAQAQTQFALKRADEAAKAEQARRDAEAELMAKMHESQAQLELDRENAREKLVADTKIAIISGLLDALKPQPKAGADGSTKTPKPDINAMLKAVSKVLNNDFTEMETEPEADDKYDQVIEMLKDLSSRKGKKLSRDSEGKIVVEYIQ